MPDWVFPTADGHVYTADGQLIGTLAGPIEASGTVAVQTRTTAVDVPIYTPGKVTYKDIPIKVTCPLNKTRFDIIDEFDEPD